MTKANGKSAAPKRKQTTCGIISKRRKSRNQQKQQKGTRRKCTKAKTFKMTKPGTTRKCTRAKPCKMTKPKNKQVKCSDPHRCFLVNQEARVLEPCNVWLDKPEAEAQFV